ncbi:tyrosine protein phosphatase [Carnobacterium sp. CS13]|uniref:tyrosine-protein phosphatase n=1 Tax=Carnobacterium sp. CS13 TaxID=2800128 RepID=UPI001913C99D|nr:CpsB/CapC family capsule biosynthesis tyrosine phosphatase [Carnobacterium sp. CS13]QQP69560.1 tyrosine protein phosphatase [Carnobacterium sp. CS13]
MIDLHCHIHGIDDGVKTMNYSLAMAYAAVAEGITHILAMPHYKNVRWDNEKTDILRDVENHQNELNDRDIPLIIFPRQEIRKIEEMMEDIQENKIQFIDELNQDFLIEFPTATIPAFMDSLFFNIQTKGITPVIVYPERNRAILNDPNKMLALIEKGALAQLTAGSYVGTFGKKNQKISRQLIVAGLVHIIASDAHNLQSRTFHLKEAYEKLEKEFDKKKVQQFKQTTKDLNNGEIIVTNPPKEVKVSKFLGLF